MKSAKADASVYLLTMLLQRLEGEKPGMLTDLIQGVKADKAAIGANVADKDHIDAVFRETLSVLERTQGLLKNTQ